MSDVKRYTLSELYETSDKLKRFINYALMQMEDKTFDRNDTIELIKQLSEWFVTLDSVFDCIENDSSYLKLFNHLYVSLDAMILAYDLLNADLTYTPSKSFGYYWTM